MCRILEQILDLVFSLDWVLSFFLSLLPVISRGGIGGVEPYTIDMKLLRCELWWGQSTVKVVYNSPVSLARSPSVASRNPLLRSLCYSLFGKHVRAG